MQKILKKLVLIIGILFITLNGIKTSAQLTKTWDKVIGSRGLDRLQCANPTTDGGYILSGISDTSPGGGVKPIGFGGTDIWIIKLKSDKKTIEWQKIFGGINDEGMGNWDMPGSYIEQTIDGGYIFGTTSKSGISGNKTSMNKGNTDYWILKLSSTGTISWQKDFGSNNEDQFSSIHELRNGYIIGGSSNSNAGGDKSFNPFGGIGDFDYWVLKIDKFGNTIWDYNYGANSSDNLSCMLVLNNTGHILLGGSSFSSNSIGNKTAPNKGGSDYWIVEIDDNAGIYWDQTYGGSNEDTLTDMDVDYNNPETGIALLLSGNSRSNSSADKSENNRDPSTQSTDIWVIKCDISGAIEWEKTLGVSFFDEVKDAKFLPDHNIIIGGSTSADVWWGGLEWGPGTDKTQASIGNNDIWIIKLKGAIGSKIWDQRMGTTGVDYCTSIWLTTNNDFWIGGFTWEKNNTFAPNNDRSGTLYGSTDFWISQWHPTISIILPPLISTKSALDTSNILDTALFKFNIFPNPAQDEVNLQFLMRDKNPLTLTIRDQFCKTVFSKIIQSTLGFHEEKIQIQNYLSGIYFIEIENKNERQNYKFIKK